MSEGTKSKFLLNFQSLTLLDSPNFVGKDVVLQFVRGANELTTKEANLNRMGVAEFNEKIEMKTFFEWDKGLKKYKEKKAKIQAKSIDDETVLGWCEIDLANYAVSNQYDERFIMEHLTEGIGQRSFIKVEIKTSDANEKGPPKKDNAGSSGNVPKKIQELQNKVDKLTMENIQKENDNKQIREDLIKLGHTEGEQLLGTLGDMFAKEVSAGTKQAKIDNSDRYKTIPDITQLEIEQLVNLDNELNTLFDKQMKKRNKNDEMIRTKIQELNDKPALRDFLFKKVSNTHLERDIISIEKEVEAMYQI